MKEENEQKKRWYDIAFLAAVFLLTCSLPFSLFIKDETIVYWLKVSLRTAFLVFAILYIRRADLGKPQFRKPPWQSLLFIPFLLMCLSNVVVAWIDQEVPKEIVSPYPIMEDALFYLLVALGEELVFRSVIYPEFKKGRPLWKAILYSSLAFALPHLLNASSWAGLGQSAIQMVYSFGLGILLCLFYEVSGNLLLPILLHFLFDFLNDALVDRLYELPWNLTFYLTNALFAVNLALYFVMMCFFLFQKKKGVGESED